MDGMQGRRRRPFSRVFLVLLNFVCFFWHSSEAIDRDETNRIPPSIYKWIEENAHICTIVPTNGESLVNFLSVEEGVKCSLCPDLRPRDVPTMACAIEVSPNDIDVDIGCHPVPELCILELKTRYAEFYSNSLPAGPPGQPAPPSSSGPPGNGGTRSEEEIFRAAGNIFSKNGDGSLIENIRTDEFEDEEEQHLVASREDSKDVFEILRANAETISSSTTTSTIRPTTKRPSKTTVRANTFSLLARPKAGNFPINLTMQEVFLHSRTAIPKIVGPQGLPSGQPEFAMEIGRPVQPPGTMAKRKRVDPDEEEENEVDELEQIEDMSRAKPCKDSHELCCFWAMSGECDANPFWMRVKCPRTCGTCGCRVKSADKCKSIGVKCILRSTSTTTTSTSTTTSSLPTTTRRSTTTESTTPSSSTPTPPPLTFPSRRRSRPTPPAKMPGHRPQRPKQRTKTSHGPMTTTMPSPTETTPSSLSTPSPAEATEESTTLGNCFNYHKLCDFWAKMGECTSNPFWMRPHCQKACSSCGENLGDISTPEPRPASAGPGCANEHVLCPFWAFIGECTRNARWMVVNCRASCQLCATK